MYIYKQINIYIYICDSNLCSNNYSSSAKGFLFHKRSAKGFCSTNLCGTPSPLQKEAFPTRDSVSDLLSSLPPAFVAHAPLTKDSCTVNQGPAWGNVLLCSLGSAMFHLQFHHLAPHGMETQPWSAEHPSKPCLQLTPVQASTRLLLDEAHETTALDCRGGLLLED